MQLSAALRVMPSPAVMAQLETLCDPVYLHQVKARGADGRVTAYPDLPAALEAYKRAPAGASEWRFHFHVPLDFEGAGDLRSTHDGLDAEFFREIARPATAHLEIETYTFNVLPPALRPPSVTESIAREYAWVLKRLG